MLQEHHALFSNVIQPVNGVLLHGCAVGADTQQCFSLVQDCQLGTVTWSYKSMALYMVLLHSNYCHLHKLLASAHGPLPQPTRMQVLNTQP